MKKSIFVALLSFMSVVVCGQSFEVPKNYKLETKEDYQKYEPQVLQAIDWALKTPLNKEIDKRTEVYTFLMAWVEGTPNVGVKLDTFVMNLTKKNKDLLFPYIMGWIKYSLENNYAKDDLQTTKTGTEVLVKFYEDNKSVLKKDKEVEKYKKLIEKNQLEEELKKMFK